MSKFCRPSSSVEHSCPSKTRFPKGGKTTSVLQPRPFCCCTAKTTVVKSENLEISCIPSRRVDTLPLVAYAQSANQPILHWELLRLPPGRHSRSHLCRRRFAHRLPTLLSSEACCHHFHSKCFHLQRAWQHGMKFKCVQHVEKPENRGLPSTPHIASMASIMSIMWTQWERALLAYHWHLVNNIKFS